MENSVNYSTDFETTTDVNDCRVWAWCCCEIGNENNIFYGNCISSFIEHVQEYQGVYYFHNLAFDGEFILNYLLKMVLSVQLNVNNIRLKLLLVIQVNFTR